ncbi:MAG: hypothetical protein ACYCTE_04080 [Acidimicrobiales bacterium]
MVGTVVVGTVVVGTVVVIGTVVVGDVVVAGGLLVFVLDTAAAAPDERVCVRAVLGERGRV